MLKKKLLSGVAAFLVSFIVTALLAATLAELRNEFFECRTTRAFGWPFPWWVVDGCRPAEGEILAYRLGNVALYLLVGGIAFRGLYRAILLDLFSAPD